MNHNQVALFSKTGYNLMPREKMEHIGVSACRCKVERRAVSGQMVLFVKYIDIYVETKSIVVDFNSAIFEHVRRPFLF